MNENVIFSNGYLKIFIKCNEVYIESFKKGFPFEQLNNFFSSHPEIGVTNYNVLRNAITQAPKKAEKFGELKERFVIDISPDQLTATVILNVQKQEIDISNRDQLIKECTINLEKSGIVSGIKMDVLNNEISCGKQYIIAEGIPPVNGTDSIIKMYDLTEPKPNVSKDGKVDFYELKLIKTVNAGDWLGERIDATEGIPGKTVKGLEINPVPGKNYPLEYDKNSVIEFYDSTSKKTILFSRINGAVNYSNGKISVSNYLEINGDVNLSTGNVKFDGFLTIKGTITDGFSVEATKDIEINGDIGVGNIKGITSTGGSIFIKGGVVSKCKSEIVAARHVFTKFVDNAIIHSGESTHVGYYCINSNITAKEVILDSSSGQIIGGNIKAQYRVLAPVIGSEIEKRTVIEVLGFDRDSLVGEVENMLTQINTLKNNQQKLKQTLSSLESLAQPDPFQQKQYMDTSEMLLKLKDEIKDLEEKRKTAIVYLKTRGEGEITVTKKIYPNCMLTLKNRTINITSATLATSYYIQNSQIKQT